MKKLSKPVLAEGEVTGHAHILPEDIDVYETDEKTREFNLTSPKKLSHQEHKEIELPSGKYESDRIVEIDPFTEEIRKVED